MYDGIAFMFGNGTPRSKQHCVIAATSSAGEDMTGC